MPRTGLFRKLFTVLAAMSLITGVASLSEWLTCPSTGRTWHFVIELGSPATQHNLDLTLTPHLAFGLYQNKTTRWTMTQMTFPAGLPVLASAILPILWLMRRKPPAPAGHCRRCGYDVRATPDKCPECGCVLPADASLRDSR